MSISENYQTITFHIESKIATLTINRPDQLNALNRTVLSEIRDLIKSLNNTYDMRGLIITGSGEKAFVAGADIKEMGQLDEDAGYALGKLGQEVTLALENLHLPVIAAVNGHALGGGCELAMSCDIILATNRASFGQPEVKLGLIPGFGGTQRLVKYVGLMRARELIYTGKIINAQTAKEWGLVTDLYDSPSELLVAARSLIEQMEKSSPFAIQKAKEAINGGIGTTTKYGLEIELTKFRNCFAHQDKKIGITAFLEKKTPEFDWRQL